MPPEAMPDPLKRTLKRISLILFSMLMVGCRSINNSQWLYLSVGIVEEREFSSEPSCSDECRIVQGGLKEFFQFLSEERFSPEFSSQGKLSCCGMVGSLDGRRWYIPVVNANGKVRTSSDEISFDDGKTVHKVEVPLENAVLLGNQGEWIVVVPVFDADENFQKTSVYVFRSVDAGCIRFNDLPPIESGVDTNSGAVLVSGGSYACVRRSSERLLFKRCCVFVSGVTYDLEFQRLEAKGARVLTAVRCFPRNGRYPEDGYKYGLVLSIDGGETWRLLRNPCTGNFLEDLPYMSWGIGDDDQIVCSDAEQIYVLNTETTEGNKCPHLGFMGNRIFVSGNVLLSCQRGGGLWQSDVFAVYGQQIVEHDVTEGSFLRWKWPILQELLFLRKSYDRRLAKKLSTP